MAYIGKDLNDIATANIAVNTMIGNGSTTTMAISMGSKGVGSVNDVSVFVSGIQQRPGTDFTLSGSTITFTTAPADGVKVVAMSHGDSWNNAPSDNTVTDAKLKDASVTNEKIIGLDAGKLSGSLSGSGVNLTNLNAANISGTLPAIDGSALTGISAYENETSDPTATENKTLGTMWVNKTSGEMYILTDDTTNANVWTNVGDGTGNQPFTGMVATGGSITTDGDYKVHSFTTSGSFSFNVTTAGTLPEVEYLVIAGGGGGAYSGNCGGGGGAGGYLTGTVTLSAGTHSVIVGAGGAGRTSNADGGDGTNGVFDYGTTITSIGGGGGGYDTNSGHTGGSGGGGGGGGNTSGGAATSGQGNDGAGGVVTLTLSGGGGGAGGVGETPSSNNPSDGGVGLASDILITGQDVFRAGGGGGGWYGAAGAYTAQGGNGGGGAGGSGSSQHAVAGDANFGGGGGGGGRTPGVGNSNGAAGGSGIVILRYKFQ